eukprot:6213588-Pleurochrysis_carterae.AAC.12
MPNAPAVCPAVTEVVLKAQLSAANEHFNSVRCRLREIKCMYTNAGVAMHRCKGAVVQRGMLAGDNARVAVPGNCRGGITQGQSRRGNHAGTTCSADEKPITSTAMLAPSCASGSLHFSFVDCASRRMAWARTCDKPIILVSSLKTRSQAQSCTAAPFRAYDVESGRMDWV